MLDEEKDPMELLDEGDDDEDLEGAGMHVEGEDDPAAVDDDEEEVPPMEEDR